MEIQIRRIFPPLSTLSLERYPLPQVGPVAQRLERAAHNRLVAGSNPAGPTTRFLSAQG